MFLFMQNFTVRLVYLLVSLLNHVVKNRKAVRGEENGEGEQEEEEGEEETRDQCYCDPYE